MGDVYGYSDDEMRIRELNKNKLSESPNEGSYRVT